MQARLLYRVTLFVLSDSEKMKIGQLGRTTKRESESEALNLKGGVNPPQRDERRQ